MNTLLITVGIPVVIGIAFLLLTGFVVARLYKRATRETSLLRTGSGGLKVITDAGCLVIPMLHELTKVNMRTLQISVGRKGEEAMITKDRLRVDSRVEFFVRVAANKDAIAIAAQTLGDRTFSTDKMREMIEGKLIDGLRAVAAQMTMNELHEKRSDFVQRVKEIVAEDLTKNGLELESVSLVALDQTSFDTLDQNNAFNAEGMRNLAEVIAIQQTARAKAQSEARVNVAQTEQQAEIREMLIKRDEEEARIANAIKIAEMQAGEKSEIAKRNEEVRKVEENSRISREREIQEAEIDKTRNLEIKEQERAIAIAQKSEEQSHARAKADEARAIQILAEEKVTTAAAVETAQRSKQIAVLKAEEDAERGATEIRVRASAEKAAANDKAESIRVGAQADADAIIIRAEANKVAALAEAEGKEKLIEAENALGEAILTHRENMERLSILPSLIEAMVKPAEKIDSIRIHQVNGLGGSTNGGAGGKGGGSAINDLNDLLSAQAIQIPLLNKISQQAGVTLDEGLNGLIKSYGGNDAAKTNESTSSNDD
jgi:uncharacterized membrane protein YqiK